MSIFKQALANLGLDPSTPVTAESYRAIEAEAARIRAAATPGSPTHDPRKAPSIAVSELELQLAVLTDAGMTRGEAFEAIHTGAGRPTPQMMQAKREELQQRADEQALLTYEASRAGKVEAAEAALQAKAERQRLAEGARELVRDHFGDATDRLTDEEALIAAGIEESASARHARELDERAARKFEGSGMPLDIEPISTDARLSDVWSES